MRQRIQVRLRVVVAILAVWTIVDGGAAMSAGSAGKQAPSPDVHYVPTPTAVVEAMLKLADVTARDVVYDLGSGDGRIVITAAKEYGARGVGIELDAELVKQAKKNARKAGVENRVSFVQADIFKADLSPATVVTLYLLRSINLRLQPKLKRELRPGARIVSHRFDMGDWTPARQESVRGTTVFLWRIE